MHRVDAERLLHRLLLRLLERAVELVRRTDQERAGEGRGEAGEARIERLLLLVDAQVLRLRMIFLGVGLAEHHVMARRAGDAVARERAVIGERRVGQRRHRIVVVRIRHRVDLLARERLAGPGLGLGVDRELALAENAVTAEARVLDQGLVLRMERAGLARELREEDRIAPGKPHRRAAPGAVGRDVDQLSVRPRLRHVVLQPGAARAVAAETLVRGQELAMRGRLARLRPDAVVGLRLHLHLLGALRRRFAERS